jgi:hypothetical protein
MKFISDFFHYGFWGMALIEFGFYSLIGNLVFSLFIVFYGEAKNKIKIILFGTPFVSLISTALLLRKITQENDQTPIGLGLRVIFFIWMSYFILIPQLAMRAIIKASLRPPGKGDRLLALGLRVVLSVILPYVLAIIHGTIGSRIFGITSD